MSLVSHFFRKGLFLCLGFSFFWNIGSFYFEFVKNQRAIEKFLDEIQKEDLNYLSSSIWSDTAFQIENKLLDWEGNHFIQYLEVERKNLPSLKRGTKGARIKKSFPLTYQFQDKKVEVGSLYIEFSKIDVLEDALLKTLGPFLVNLIQALVLHIFLTTLLYFLEKNRGLKKNEN